MGDWVISIDPGREKCGVALVGPTQGVKLQKVVPTDELVSVVEEIATANNVFTIVIGDRTSHLSAINKLNTLLVNGKALTITPIDEHRSSDEARGRYWCDHPPKGLAKLIPLGLQVPPIPVDDYVAVILAERYFRKCKNNP